MSESHPWSVIVEHRTTKTKVPTMSDRFKCQKIAREETNCQSFHKLLATSSLKWHSSNPWLHAPPYRNGIDFHPRLPLSTVCDRKGFSSSLYLHPPSTAHQLHRIPLPTMWENRKVKTFILSYIWWSVLITSRTLEGTREQAVAITDCKRFVSRPSSLLLAVASSADDNRYR